MAKTPDEYKALVGNQYKRAINLQKKKNKELVCYNTDGGEEQENW